MESFPSSFFDIVHDRHIAGDIKYRTVPGVDDVIPMWIADMDFKSPPAVEEALIAAVKHGIFGYAETDAEYDELVTAWYQKRMSWTIVPESILKAPGVMFAIAAAIRALSRPNDSVLICQPVYYPFAKIIPANDRKLVVTELVLRAGRYEIDFTDLEDKIRTNAVKIILLCSPHNPVGRVWTREELLEIGRICSQYNVYIISDEIHSDFIFTDHPHLPLASLSEELAQRTITCIAPTKTFNLAGLQASNIIIPNEKIRRRVYQECRATGYSNLNTLAIAATKAAYQNGELWLESLLSYLSGNYDALKEAFPEHGMISMIPPEGTYLAWLDCRRLGLTDSELETFFLRQARVRLHGGATFGAGGSGFVRMNIACPRSVLLEGIARIRRALDTQGYK